MEKINFDGLLQFIKEQETVAATKYGYNFNLLSEQCGTIVENSHTNILMRILQYKNRYGYVLLEDFISLAGFDICIADREVMFRTEYQGEVNSQGRIDGLIWQKDNFAIIVENKINHAGNQKGQIARYVETVVNDSIAEKDRIFVVFLTRDGLEMPDKDSQEYLQECGICKSIGDEEVSGPRYFACSYREHIYNWLRDAVQPMILQKDVVMNAGIIQYVDYLDGMLGHQAVGNAMLQASEKWFDHNVKMPKDVAEQNALLYNIYRELSLSVPAGSSPDDAKFRSDCVNVLKNVIDLKNEQLMSVLLNVTKHFFCSGKNPVIGEYHLNHHFNYYYISIRDKKWQRGVDFGWYPLGMKKLKEGRQLTLYFNFGGKRLDSTIEDKLPKGFSYHEKSKTYRTAIDVPDAQSFLGLNEESQKLFLETAYNEYVIPVIKNVLPRIV